MNQVSALANRPLVVGSPATTLDLIADPARNFVIIMKDSQIYQNMARYSLATQVVRRGNAEVDLISESATIELIS